MKFHQLPIGAEFYFHGILHSKLNNIIAVNSETQKQILIKRSDTVEAVAAAASAPDCGEQAGNKLLGQALKEMQQACVQELKSLQDGVSLDLIEARLSQIRQEIEKQYREKR